MFDFLIVYAGALALGFSLGIKLNGDGVLGFAKRVSFSAALGAVFTAVMSLIFFGWTGLEEVLREITLYVAGVGALLGGSGALIGSLFRAISKREV